MPNRTASHRRRVLDRRWGRVLVLAGLICLAVVVVAAPANAADLTAAQPSPAQPPPASLEQVIDRLRAYVVTLLAGLATLFATVGGVRYLMAGSDPTEVAKAKSALKFAAVGYGVAVLAPLLVNILKGIVGGP
ncbi:MAG: pilin [Sporichthyaceae bacterium]|nr:pilin [Sporichthyaceae bacterium]